MRLSKFLAGFSMMTMAACGGMEMAEGQAESSVEMKTTARFLRSENAVPNQYIVVFKDSVTDVRGLADALSVGGQKLHVYEHALKGFAVRMPEAAARALLNHPSVDYVEEDGVATVDATQTGAPWNLDRIDQRNLPLSGTFSYTNTGAGVNAYILDTGIRRTHSQFGWRAVTGYDAVTTGGTAEDCHGHGTHVAGTVGGSTYGVAKGVRLYAVRVLDCNGSGTWSQVIAGVDWVKNNHVKPAVANMSLGGSANTSVDTAVTNAISAGVTFAIAAGNNNASACNYSPARTPNAITVGAATSTDARSSFSNFGTCVDIFAPGSSILSAYHTSDTATSTMSGTSMASPHVAGVAAQYLQSNPWAAPATVAAAIINNATEGKVTNPGVGSPNKLLYTNY